MHILDGLFNGLGVFMAGLGIFFMGLGFLWWCSLYEKIKLPKKKT